MIRLGQKGGHVFVRNTFVSCKCNVKRRSHFSGLTLTEVIGQKGGHMQRNWPIPNCSQNFVKIYQQLFEAVILKFEVK